MVKCTQRIFKLNGVDGKLSAPQFDESRQDFIDPGVEEEQFYAT